MPGTSTTGSTGRCSSSPSATRTDDWRTIETSITDLRSEPAVGGFVLNARDVTDRKGMEQRLRYQATHDELTGLANRVQRPRRARRDARTQQRQHDRRGASSSDWTTSRTSTTRSATASATDCSCSVAERITALLGFGDVAARVGGDEFVVVLERAHGENHVTDLAEQVLSAIALALRRSTAAS